MASDKRLPLVDTLVLDNVCEYRRNSYITIN